MHVCSLATPFPFFHPVPLTPPLFNNLLMSQTHSPSVSLSETFLLTYYVSDIVLGDANTVATACVFKEFIALGKILNRQLLIALVMLQKREVENSVVAYSKDP